MKLIATTTLSSNGTAILDLINIPQSFTDLVVLASLRTTRTTFTADDLHFRINSSSVNSSVKRLQGDGINPGQSFTADNPPIANAAGATANTFSSLSVYIPNYAGSTAKSVSLDSVTENNAIQGYQVLSAQLTNSTNAVTSIGVRSTTSSNFLTGTTISLYGITKGSDGITTAS
jgi:hypothetical protein